MEGKKGVGGNRTHNKSAGSQCGRNISTTCDSKAEGRKGSHVALPVALWLSLGGVGDGAGRRG